MPDQSHRPARNLVSRSLGALGRSKAAPPSNAKEPCFGCGEETAVGSVFFSDRHTVTGSDGARVLCSLCDARIRASHKGGRLTDEEVRNLVDNGAAASYLWSSGGGLNVG